MEKPGFLFVVQPCTNLLHSKHCFSGLRLMSIFKALENTGKSKGTCFVHGLSPTYAILLCFLPALKTESFVCFHQSCDPATLIKLDSVFREERPSLVWFPPLAAPPDGLGALKPAFSPRSRLGYFRILCLVSISRAMGLTLGPGFNGQPQPWCRLVGNGR